MQRTRNEYVGDGNKYVMPTNKYVKVRPRRQKFTR